MLLLLVRRLAEQKKEEGNAHYKNKEYHKALACYSRAIGKQTLSSSSSSSFSSSSFSSRAIENPNEIERETAP